MSTKADDEAALREAFLVLANEKGDDGISLGKRHDAFRLLQSSYAQDTSKSASYSEELQRVFALRYDEWKKSPLGELESNMSSIRLESKTIINDKIRGCLFGAALGDATGLATEFLSKSTIQKHYSEVTLSPLCIKSNNTSSIYPDLHRCCFPPGDWTDDTDQIILVLQSLLETGGGYVESKGADSAGDKQVSSISLLSKSFAKNLMDWKGHCFPGLGDTQGAGLGRATKIVLQQPAFLSDPTEAANDVWVKGGKKSAANGAIMRTVATGIPYFWKLNIVESNTVAICQTTHSDPRCVASCIIVANIIARILQASMMISVDAEDDILNLEEIISSSIERGSHYLEAEDQVQELYHYTNINQTLESLELDDPNSIG